MPFLPYHKYMKPKRKVSMGTETKKKTQRWSETICRKKGKTNFILFLKVKIQAKNIYHETKLVFRMCVCVRLYFGTHTHYDRSEMCVCLLRKDTNGCLPCSLYACFKSLLTHTLAHSHTRPTTVYMHITWQPLNVFFHSLFSLLMLMVRL